MIPTTIGALLAAIGIAGMDRALRANLIAKCGKAVEVTGDVDTLMLDKTGTITMGNRKATRFVPLGDVPAVEVGRLTAHQLLFNSPSGFCENLGCGNATDDSQQNRRSAWEFHGSKEYKYPAVSP